ncbi:NUDIX hydrolase domain [Syntrophomonas zehnderi OL-4]|uniref:NUDIX hydrolase domain n=1 Tax=Syntrophomonas zehnderi OL-4 TaxID=690567 RepID=A0A0E4C8I1_9FIRM|nr:NUDIX hydrolase [Syntrophomonas zehnderi]CFX50640.1 NUDIX hydrolase domain [Syntrophomonas zehnderi OL-4]
MELREKTLKSQEIFRGRIVNLRVDTVLLPDQRQSTREVIEHVPAVAIVALDEKGDIVLVRQFRKPVEEVLLEIPAGLMDAGEEPLISAQRELREETGLTASHWEKILSYYSTPGFTNECLHLYLATGLSPGEVEPDEDEFVEIVSMPLEKAYDLIFKGQIKDGKSIIGIQYAMQKAGE